MQCPHQKFYVQRMFVHCFPGTWHSVIFLCTWTFCKRKANMQIGNGIFTKYMEYIVLKKICKIIWIVNILTFYQLQKWQKFAFLEDDMYKVHLKALFVAILLNFLGTKSRMMWSQTEISSHPNLISFQIFHKFLFCNK